MVETDRISVVVVTYNGEAYLTEQLTSILENLREQDEVIVSDDGSKDKTLEIIQNYTELDCRVRFVEGPHQGVKKNVEYALRQCNGEYIFLADQDDIWMPDKIKEVMEVFEKENCHLVIHDARVIQGRERDDFVLPSFMEFRSAKAGIWKNIIKNSYIGCCMAFRASLKERVIPIPPDIEMHDQWIGILNDYYYGDSVFLKKPLILYRRHGENSSEMTRYGMGRMIRNRIVFCIRFLQKIFKIHKRMGKF
ncbi:MAG: glycosyltransferase family 2 protein [Lachnospiraceae bacterium]|nr:glycosyltransferase family 2 protein [Lachnospiraceae bacterium]